MPVIKVSAVKTKRLILRPFKLSDYEEWFEVCVNRLPRQSKWDLEPVAAKKCTRSFFKKLVKEYRDLEKEDDYYRFVAIERKSGKIVGHVDFDIHVRGSLQSANFGYRIHSRYWGMGYGQEAAAAGLRIGIQQLKLNRLEAAINLDNKKSKRLAKAIGMRREGIKKRYWYEDGAWVDHLIYVANPEDIGMKPRKPF